MTETPVPPADHDHAPNAGQFALLRQRRFAPLFWTQFAGAANDNLFKFAFTVLVTYQVQVAWLPPSLAGLVIGALFILPFVLFSATSGQLTDKFEKTRIIRAVKNLEIAIMAVAALGWATDQIALLLACVFLMGVHSALFGPVKLAYLPQVLPEHALTGGNGMVQMGTFVAILLGNVAGGLLIAWPGVGSTAVAVSCLILALAGRWAAQHIPLAPAPAPDLPLRWNPFTETWRNLQHARAEPVVFRSLLGISWMWFFGAVFLSQFPSLAKEVLHGDERVASLLLVVFSVGVGAGALWCERLSRRHVEIGLVPLGAVGMSVFAIDLYLATRALPPEALMGAGDFLAQPRHWRVLADLLLLSLSAGIYSVPMYALVQLRSPATHRARIIGANNILNAVFMVVSAVLAGALLGAGFSVPEVFLATGLANAAVAGFIFWLVPEYLLRCVAWLATRCLYRFRVQGEAHIPQQGAAVLACNQVGVLDAVLLMAASPRPLVCVVEPRTLQVPVLGWLLRRARAMAITPQADDPQAHEAGLERAVQLLREGELLAFFPEGILHLIERARAQGLEAPVVPMALSHAGAAMAPPQRRGFRSRVTLHVGAPMAAHAVQPDLLHAHLAQLR